MPSYKRSWNGKWWTIYEDRDGMLGWFSPAPGGGWEWQTDLRGLRMAQQLQGTSPTLEAAQVVFKSTYERWRAQFTDEHFDRVYRRSKPDPL